MRRKKQGKVTRSPKCLGFVNFSLFCLRRSLWVTTCWCWTRTCPMFMDWLPLIHLPQLLEVTSLIWLLPSLAFSYYSKANTMLPHRLIEPSLFPNMTVPSEWWSKWCTQLMRLGHSRLPSLVAGIWGTWDFFLSPKRFRFWGVCLGGWQKQNKRGLVRFVLKHQDRGHQKMQALVLPTSDHYMKRLYLKQESLASRYLEKSGSLWELDFWLGTLVEIIWNLLIS